MKNFIFTLIFLLCFPCAYGGNHEATVERIACFYKQYIALELSNSDYKDTKALLVNNITEEALQKTYRGSTSSGTNQIIRAQDVNEVMLATIEVTHLEDDWYMVTYYWTANDDSSKTQITLKAESIGDKLQITYIPHSANKGEYGDKLIGLPLKRNIDDITHESEQDFLESFYDVYLYNYCVMSLDLYPNLKDLRNRYLSENAQSNFKKADDGWMFDNIDGFDLLINDFEFDAMWYNSFKIDDIDSGKYEVSYESGGDISAVYLTVIKGGDGYKIDSISVAK